MDPRQRRPLVTFWLGARDEEIPPCRSADHRSVRPDAAFNAAQYYRWTAVAHTTQHYHEVRVTPAELTQALAAFFSIVR